MSSSIELRGGTLNHIFLNPNKEIVKKEFSYGNGIETSISKRLVSEYWSMKLMDISPVFHGTDSASIFMSYIDGEKELDHAIYNYPESVADMVYRQAGEMLRRIHTVIHADSSYYHLEHRKKINNAIIRSQDILHRKGVNPITLRTSLFNSYSEKEIERTGLVWTHGDYWLNNLIGRRMNNHFRLEGIIDWESAGLGSPYEDFAIVKMSIEDEHEGSSGPFWKGYGYKPIPDLQRHYSILKTLEWMIADGPETNGNYDTPFYRKKLEMIRNSL